MLHKSPRGRLFIVSAPSGAGKTSLCEWVLKRMPNVKRSISYTTRKRRNTEVNGKDYYFISENIFKKMINEKKFSEWAIVHGAYYGTDRQQIEEMVRKGVNVILNIDVQGAEQLRHIYKKAITIFIHTPSFEELKKRLIHRKSESKESIKKRLREAEIELQASSTYNYQIINDVLENAAQRLKDIIELERYKS